MATSKDIYQQGHLQGLTNEQIEDIIKSTGKKDAILYILNAAKAALGLQTMIDDVADKDLNDHLESPTTPSTVSGVASPTLYNRRHKSGRRRV